MTKKVKSFAVDVESYNELFMMFKENYVDVSLSYCFDKYTKEMLAYLKSVKNELEESKISIPMSFIIETAAREPIFKILSEVPSKDGKETPMLREVKRLKEKYDLYKANEPSDKSDIILGKLDKKFKVKATMKYILKTIMEEIKRRGDLTDDEYIQIIRGIGGKEFQKYLREEMAPSLAKIDPDIKEIIKKMFKANNKKEIS
ncbi:MAG: hypothetical protein A4E64_00313 [Syntrophorhabdus sp. PtaU1.Bin058]|nr:MAG: hypothetical protein A4E64_00313 [Syntrophorhabdus sp. PtaU1.Bin058]